MANDIAFLHQLLRPKGDGGADRMRRIGIAMAEDAEAFGLTRQRVIDPVGHHDSGNRQIGRGKCFRTGQHVGAHIHRLRSPHTAGPAKAAYDLIGDKQHIMFF